jgi:hypothetical protein
VASWPCGSNYFSIFVASELFLFLPSKYSLCKDLSLIPLLIFFSKGGLKYFKKHFGLFL